MASCVTHRNHSEEKECILLLSQLSQPVLWIWVFISLLFPIPFCWSLCMCVMGVASLWAPGGTTHMLRFNTSTAWLNTGFLWLIASLFLMSCGSGGVFSWILFLWLSLQLWVIFVVSSCASELLCFYLLHYIHYQPPHPIPTRWRHLKPACLLPS